MTHSRSLTFKIALACIVSGLIAGVLAAGQCPSAESGCQIAALRPIASEVAPWTAWLHWINWLPGAVFGLLYAAAAASKDSPRPLRRIGLYALASALAYVLAGLVFYMFLTPATDDPIGLALWMWPAGFAAGLVGASLLAAAWARNEQAMGGPLARSRRWIPSVVGAVAGVLFVWIGSYGEQHILIAWPLAFIVWQVSVGLTMPRRLTA